MLLFMNSTMCKRSRIDDEHQHHIHHHKVEDNKKENIVNSCKSLTVWRKSLLFSCQGFTVIGSDGNLAYRVENYIKHPSEIVLMDGSGKSILTISRRKKLGISESWFIYEGEAKDSSSSSSSSTKKPLCNVRKHQNILLQNNLNVLAYVYEGVSDKRHAYIIEGSYPNRSCKILDEKRRVVAEIKTKQDITKGVSYGSEVFLLIVSPGFDCGLAMAIILLLDQMFS